MKYRLREMWQQYERVSGKKLTWRELAEKSGVTLRVLQRVEKNENVTIETLEKIAQALGCRVRDLLDETER